MKKKNDDPTLRGRNSVMVGIRIPNGIYGIVLEQAQKKGVSIGAFLKQKVEAYALSVDSKSTQPSIIRKAAEAEEKGYNPTQPLAFYNPAIHKAGDRVLVKRGKSVEEAIVPALDGDGQPIYGEPFSSVQGKLSRTMPE